MLPARAGLLLRKDGFDYGLRRQDAAWSFAVEFPQWYGGAFEEPYSVSAAWRYPAVMRIQRLNWMAWHFYAYPCPNMEYWTLFYHLN